ncbi:MAG TPA: hypothetical protein PK864_05565 [Syntrophorhabdaceae bacterium]|nr:hypothetical protein [Syntrophorhabdaceae bacterium]HOT42492.1 hypothetical protein [Syntrophorhabdaceae bacterium]HPC65940.1 hypothetical protein [Syntrophorhabdaceae bacterium]HQE81007.1 hypothetical protein [Syntrophorhabdaceae bacterium]HQH44094.1 hypothetical protein [Syntrophorhabdaceae bacterium]
MVIKVETKRINEEKSKIDLIRESICVYKKCMECKTLFRRGELCFSYIEDFVDDRGRSCLYKLKEMCHTLYRRSDEATYKEKLYDMTVGYIFHEAMKFRENLYQIEYYRPNYIREMAEFTDTEKKILQEINLLTKKAEKRLNEGIKEIKKLLRELVSQLKDLIKLYKDSYLMPRFILENQKDLITIYGKKGYSRLLNELYKDGRELLIQKAAKSYLESEYYDISRQLLKKILYMNKGNTKAEFFYLYSSAFHFFFKNRFMKALNFAKNALSIDIKDMDEDVSHYRERLNNLMSDITKELKRKK